MSQISNAWIIDQLVADDEMILLLVEGAEHVLTAQINKITTVDFSNTFVIFTINGDVIANFELSLVDTDQVNVLPWVYMVACNSGLDNFPTSGYWNYWRSQTTDNGDGTISLQLPGQVVTIQKHSHPISAIFDPADGVTNPSQPTFPQYPDVIVTSTIAGTAFTMSLVFPYDQDITVIQENENYISGAITDEILIAEPYDRPALLDDQPAIVVLRPDPDAPMSLGSQLGEENDTIYLEARSWTKQTTHDLKKRIKEILTDANGPLSDGTAIKRVRYDWSQDPRLNADGKTYESQVRFVVNLV